MDILPVYTDLVELYLDEAERCDMSFYFGLYDSGTYWVNKDYRTEIDINKDFCDEVIQRYGHKSRLEVGIFLMKLDGTRKE